MGKSSLYVPIGKNTIAQIGEWAFLDTTSSVAVEVPTKLGSIVTAIATPEAYAGSVAAGGHVLYCDKTITSGAVTIGNKAWVDANLKFSYMFLGGYGATPGNVSST